MKKSKTSTRKRVARSLHAVDMRRRRPLKDETIRRIVDKMPGGLKGFCVTWGWLNFARRIERAHKIR